MATCVFDNPDTSVREYWKDGSLLHYISKQALPGGKLDWKAGQSIGDKTARKGQGVKHKVTYLGEDKWECSCGRASNAYQMLTHITDSGERLAKLLEEVGWGQECSFCKYSLESSQCLPFGSTFVTENLWECLAERDELCVRLEVKEEGKHEG